jgi:hypothetical protein
MPTLFLSKLFEWNLNLVPRILFNVYADEYRHRQDH